MNGCCARSHVVSALLFFVLAGSTAGCSSGASHVSIPPVRVVQSQSSQLSTADLEDKLPTIADAEIDASIDMTLPSDERRVMHDVMARLPLKARKNVVYVDKKGRIYANHAELKAGTHIRPIRGNKIVDESGHVYAAPPAAPRPNLPRLGENRGRRTSEYNPPQVSESGAWVRFLPAYAGYTKAVLGFIVPHYATSMNQVGPNEDTGYVYTGGWNQDGSDSVDAGFDYSAARDQMNLFLSSSASGLGQVFNNSFNWEVGKPTAAQFLFDGTNLVVWGDGYDQWDRVNSLSVVEQPMNRASWASGQDVMKYMLTIAQGPVPVPDPGYYLDDYSFGASGYTPTVELRGFYAGVPGTNVGCSFGTSSCSNGDELGYELVPDDGHVLVSAPFFTGTSDGPPGQYAYHVGIQLDPAASCTFDSYGYCILSSTTGQYTENCGTIDGYGPVPELLGSNSYVVANSRGGTSTYYDTWTDDNTGYCRSYETWYPNEPSQALGDPNLP